MGPFEKNWPLVFISEFCQIISKNFIWWFVIKTIIKTTETTYRGWSLFLWKLRKEKNGTVNIISGQIFHNKISLQNRLFLLSSGYSLYFIIFNDLIFKWWFSESPIFVHTSIITCNIIMIWWLDAIVSTIKWY